MSDYKLDDKGSIPGTGKGFVVSLCVQTSSEAHPASYINTDYFPNSIKQVVIVMEVRYVFFGLGTKLLGIFRLTRTSEG
jgi:hypothetical protein